VRRALDQFPFRVEASWVRWYPAAVVIAALSLAILCSRPTLAAGHPGRSGSVNAEFLAKASNGYEAKLSSQGDKVRLSFVRRSFELTYRFQARVTAAGIRARIADLGTIDLRFVPTGQASRVRLPRNCTGGAPKAIPGRFVGAFHFRGERGTTSVDLSHASGRVITPAWHCRNESFKELAESGPTETTYTLLEGHQRKRHLYLVSFTTTDAKHPVPGWAEVGAGMITRRGAVKVAHVAVEFAPHIFTFGSESPNKTVEPSGPFKGRATYCPPCAPNSRWTGDLRVTLPGIPGKVLLTGSSFNITQKQIRTEGAEGNSPVWSSMRLGPQAQFLGRYGSGRRRMGGVLGERDTRNRTLPSSSVAG